MVTTAILLVGGKGTRLSEFLPDCPKPLAPIAGQPVLELIIEHLAKFGIRRVVLATGFEAKRFEHYHQKYISDCEIICWPESEPLGSAGAILNCKQWVREPAFAVMNGDTVIEADLSAAFSHVPSHLATIALISVPDAARYGSVKLDKQGHINSFVDKGYSGPGLVNAGLFLFQEAIFETIQQKKTSLNKNFISLENDLFPELAKQKKISSFPLSGRFVDIGIPQDYTSYNYEISVPKILKLDNGSEILSILQMALNKNDVLSIRINSKEITYLHALFPQAVFEVDPNIDSVIFSFKEAQGKSLSQIKIASQIASGSNFRDQIEKSWLWLKTNRGPA